MKKSIFCSTFAIAATMIPSLAIASFDDQFRCEPVGDGQYVITISAKDANKASVYYDIQKEGVVMPPAPLISLTAAYNYPESGARYVGGEYMLLTTNRTAVLLYGIGTKQEGHTECGMDSVQSEDGAGEATPDAAGEPIKMNVRGRSWGGKLRAGPGMKYDKIGSLGEGDRVTLLENTGVEMNGYNWFKIRRSNGQEGYKWSGILCSGALHVIGIYEKCIND